MDNIKVVHLPIENFDPEKALESLEIHEKLDEEISESFSEIPFDSSRNSFESVELVLYGMGMQKYWENFKNLNVSLECFLNMTEDDLIEVGITDPNDRVAILESLKVHSKADSNITVTENPQEDLLIAMNIHKQLIRLKHYSSYLKLQLHNEKFTDYEGHKEFSPTRCLKILTEASIAQCDIISNLLFETSDSNNLINTLIKMHNLKMPEQMEKRLKKKSLEKSRTKRIIIKRLTVLLGVSILIVATTKLIVKR